MTRGYTNCEWCDGDDHHRLQEYQPSHPPTQVTNAGLCRVSPRRAGLRYSDFLAILDFYVYENGGMPHPKLQHTNGYGSIPIHTIFRGMNIHLPAILMFTRGTSF